MSYAQVIFCLMFIFWQMSPCDVSLLRLFMRHPRTPLTRRDRGTRFTASNNFFPRAFFYCYFIFTNATSTSRPTRFFPIWIKKICKQFFFKLIFGTPVQIWSNSVPSGENPVKGPGKPGKLDSIALKCRKLPQNPMQTNEIKGTPQQKSIKPEQIQFHR